MGKDYDTENQLREAVEKSTGPVSDEIWRELLRADHAPFDEADWQELVYRVLDHRRKVRQTTRDSGEDRMPGADRKRRVGLFLETDPEVQQDLAAARSKCFGDATALLAGREEIERWIREERDTEAKQALVKASKLLEWVGSDGWRRLATVPAGGNLDHLRALSERIARRCACTAAEAVNFLLCGEQPTTPPLSVSITASSDPVLSSFSVTVRSPDVKRRDLMRLFGYLIKHVWGTKRATTSSKRDWNLVLFHRARRQDGWKSLHREWNLQHEEYAFVSEDSFRRASERALRQFEEAALASRGALLLVPEDEHDAADEANNNHAV